MGLKKKAQPFLASKQVFFNAQLFFHRTTGLYTKTLARIIYRDITRFGVVFVVVFLGFCGAMYMALRATNSQNVFR